MDTHSSRPLGAYQESHLMIHRGSAAVEIGLTAVPFIAIVFNYWLGPLTPLMVLAMTPAFLLLRWERIYGVVTCCWPLLTLPFFCLLSVLWSEEPQSTLRYGFLYLMTILPALFMGAGMERMNVLKGVFLAFALYTVCAMLFGRWVLWSGEGAAAFAGLAGSKNASGDIAALTVLISTLMVYWSLGSRQIGWLVAALAILPFAFFCLVASKATGALIAAGVSLPFLTIWVIARRLDIRVRSSTFILAIVVMIALLLTFDYWMPPLFEAVLESSGKDAGLTGRAFLWRKADELIALRPWLGHGYASFWMIGNLDAEYIWRVMGITNREGFNFHNTPRDIRVDIGLVGLALFTAVTLYSSFRLVTKVMIKPHYLGIFCCTLLLFESPRLFFELVGFQNMHFSGLIVFMVFAYAMRPEHLTQLRRA